MWLKVCENVRVSNSLDPDETGRSVTSRWQGSQPDDACLQAAWLFWLRSLSSTVVVSRVHVLVSIRPPYIFMYTYSVLAMNIVYVYANKRLN